MNRRAKFIPSKSTDEAVKRALENEIGPLPKGVEAKDILQRMGRDIIANDAKKKWFEKAVGLDEKSTKNWSADDFYFWSFRWEGNRVLHKPGIKERLLLAIEKNDLAFFIRLGRELRRKTHVMGGNKLELLLAFGWTSGLGDAIPPLHKFTDQALLELLQLVYLPSLTFAALRKMRQRLGLSQTSKPSISKVETVGDYLRFA